MTSARFSHRHGQITDAGTLRHSHAFADVAHNHMLRVVCTRPECQGTITHNIHMAGDADDETTRAEFVRAAAKAVGVAAAVSPAPEPGRIEADLSSQLRAAVLTEMDRVGLDADGLASQLDLVPTAARELLSRDPWPLRTALLLVEGLRLPLEVRVTQRHNSHASLRRESGDR